jgi:hypothetical protein
MQGDYKKMCPQLEFMNIPDEIFAVQGLTLRHIYLNTDRQVLASCIFSKQECIIRYFRQINVDEANMNHDIQQLKTRFEFIRSSLSGHMIRPFKIIFDAKPYPYLIIIESASKPLLSIKPLTLQMARNLLV